MPKVGHRNHLTDKNTTKGQGAQLNPHNKYLIQSQEIEAEYLEHLRRENELIPEKTRYIDVHPKSLVSKVSSPDVPMNWSANPYQGCEHGCTYCYARNTHEYWGYSAGVDFERTILVKKNAPELLRQHLNKKSWKAEPIVLSGNTDCYQPAEQKFKITRELLEVFWEFKHPVGIISKNALMLRDSDIIEKLSSENLIQIVLSVTTLDEDLRRKMEPRTATSKQRLRAINELSGIGVPVSVMMAPIIPGLNSHEIFDVLEAVKSAGARNAHYTMVRLNGQIADIFSDWIEKSFPERAEKVLNHIKGAHDGKLNDSNFGRRMRGDGKMAEQIAQTFKLARKKIFRETQPIELNHVSYTKRQNPQLTLF